MSKPSYKVETVSEVSCLPVLERRPGSDTSSKDRPRSSLEATPSQQIDCPPSHFTFVRDQGMSSTPTSSWQRPPTLPQSSRREPEKPEHELTGRAAKKGVLRAFESRFLSSGAAVDGFNSGYKDVSPAGSPKSSTRGANSEGNARRLLKEAFKLCGLSHFEPTKAQIDRFISLNDLDSDGVVGQRDLEDRIEMLVDEDYLAFSSRSNQGSGFSSGAHAGLASPRNSEKELLKRSAKDKLGESGFELLTAQCKKVFQEFDAHETGYVEYENLLGLLSQVYSLFGLKQKPAPQDAKKYIEVIDADKDGRISWSDFELFLIKVLGSIDKSQVEQPPQPAPARSSSQESRENLAPNRFTTGQYANPTASSRPTPLDKPESGLASRKSSFGDDQDHNLNPRHDFSQQRSHAGSFGARNSNHSFQGSQGRMSQKPASPVFSP